MFLELDLEEIPQAKQLFLVNSQLVEPINEASKTVNVVFIDMFKYRNNNNNKI